MNPGSRLITLEGGEGAGKSIAIEALEDWFVRQHLPVWVSREPGGSELGEQLRQLILQPRQDKVEPMAELLMVFAARAQHVQQEIRPRLRAGSFVLLDRFTDASFAYQGGGRGIDMNWIATLETWVQQDLRPGLVLWLDVPVDVGLARAAERGTQADRLESESLAFMHRVHGAYAERCRLHPASHRRIDAAQPQAAVLADLLGELARYVARVLP